MSQAPRSVALTSSLELLDSSDSKESLKALAAIEKAVRNRFRTPSPQNETWFWDVGEALLRSKTSTGTEIRIEVLLLVVQWAFKEEQVERALPLAARALELARQGCAAAQERRTWTHIGLLHFALRDFPQATIAFARALEIADRIGDRAGKCGSIANLATVRLEAGLLDESIKLNLYAIDLAAGEAHLRSIEMEAHHNIAHAFILLDDVSQAMRHMEESIRLLTEPGNQMLGYNRVAMEFTFTRILVQAGDLARARERAALAMSFADSLNSRPAQIRAELARALCDAAGNQTDTAFARLVALEHEISPSALIFRDFLEVELMCNRFAGKDQSARHYRKKHLSSLAQYQRQSASRFLCALKKTFSERGATGEVILQLQTLCALTELRETASEQNAGSTNRLATLLALATGCAQAEAEAIALATGLRDIGKIAVPDAILLKREKLSATELEIMKRHTIEGCLIVTELVNCLEQRRPRTRATRDVEVLRLAAEVALHHHEWWDGSGYPRGLAKDAIPRAARVAALVDVFEGLTRGRAYRRALPISEAIQRVQALAGRQFDPALCELLPQVIRQMPPAEGGDMAVADPLPFIAANRLIDEIIESAKRSESLAAA